MRKLIYVFTVLTIFSCSLEDSIIEEEQSEIENFTSSSQKMSLVPPKGDNLTQKELFMAFNKGRSYILITDSNEDIINSRFTDSLPLPSNNFNRVPIADGVNPNASCNPFDTVDDSGFLFALSPQSTWNAPSNNLSFLITSAPNTIGNYLYQKLVNVNNYITLPPAPGMVYIESDFYEVIYYESPTFAIDPIYGDYYNYEHLGATIWPHSIITPDDGTYLRDEITCNILNTYNHSSNYNAQRIGVSDVTPDALLCTTVPSSCDGRYITTRVSVGNYQYP